MEISRRFFLGGAIAVVVAQTFKPALSSNMPTIYGNGRDDDSAGFNALFANEPVIFKRDQLGLESHDGIIIFKGNFKISKTIEITKRTKLQIADNFNIDASDLPSDMPLIFYHPDTPFDPSVMDNKITLTMGNRLVPMDQYDWSDPNFITKNRLEERDFGGIKLIDTKASEKLLNNVYVNGRRV